MFVKTKNTLHNDKLFETNNVVFAQRLLYLLNALDEPRQHPGPSDFETCDEHSESSEIWS